MSVELKYNVPVEVTKVQRDHLARNFPMIIAHKQEDGKYFIKLWDNRFKKEIQRYLKRTA